MLVGTAERGFCDLLVPVFAVLGSHIAVPRKDDFVSRRTEKHILAVASARASVQSIQTEVVQQNGYHVFDDEAISIVVNIVELLVDISPVDCSEFLSTLPLIRPQVFLEFAGPSGVLSLASEVDTPIIGAKETSRQLFVRSFHSSANLDVVKCETLKAGTLNGSNSKDQGTVAETFVFQLDARFKGLARSFKYPADHIFAFVQDLGYGH